MNAHSPYLPPRITPIDQIKRTWRLNAAVVEERMFFINQYRRALIARTERPAYLAYVEQRMVEDCKEYLRAIRAVSEAEVALAAAGISFQRV